MSLMIKLQKVSRSVLERVLAERLLELRSAVNDVPVLLN